MHASNDHDSLCVDPVEQAVGKALPQQRAERERESPTAALDLAKNFIPGDATRAIAVDFIKTAI